jgi:uncharacterized membrane protein YozB (DUF420 family)
LLAGFTQFSSEVLFRYPKIHRFIGSLYFYLIVFVNFPAALVMAYYANGGIISQTAFLLLDVLWLYFTVRAVIYVKNRDIKKHREFMIRSYALTLSAITLRSWKLFFITFTPLDDNLIYQIDSWLGFVPNIIIAEIVVLKTRGWRLTSQYSKVS